MSNTAVTIKDLKLAQSKEFTYDLQTPPRLSSLTITLQATTKTLLKNQPVNLSASKSFVMNQHGSGISRRNLSPVGI